MHFVKTIFLLLILPAMFFAANVFAQDEVIAQAYATVNVRSGPGTQYDIIGQLTSGNEVEITGRNDEESNWLRISFAGREGWVAYFTVSVLGNADQLPIVASRTPQDNTPVRATATPIHIQADSSLFITAYRTVNVRSGPGTEYVSIGSLQTGNTADVTGKSNDGEWLRINYAGEDGWVAFFVVSLTGVLEEVAIVDVDPDAETEAPPTSVEVVTRYNINLRVTPVLNSPSLALIPFGTELQAEARSNISASWLRVTFEGQTGWIIRALVNASAEFSGLPIEQ